MLPLWWSAAVSQNLGQRALIYPPAEPVSATCGAMVAEPLAEVAEVAEPLAEVAEVAEVVSATLGAMVAEPTCGGCLRNLPK